MWIKVEKGFVNIALMRSIQQSATRNGFDVEAFFGDGEGKGVILETFDDSDAADAYMTAIEQILTESKVLFDPKSVRPARRMGFSG